MALLDDNEIKPGLSSYQSISPRHELLDKKKYSLGTNSSLSATFGLGSSASSTTVSMELADHIRRTDGDNVALIPLPARKFNSRLSHVFLTTLILNIAGIFIGNGFVFSTSVEHRLALYVGGGVVGAICVSITFHHLGRKASIYISLVIFLIGYILVSFCSFANYTSLLIIGHILTGVGMGIVTAIIPVYIAEISVPRVRGMLVSLFQVFIAFGSLVTLIIQALYIWFHNLTPKHLPVSYSLISMLMSFLVFITALLLLFIRNSPYWLLSIGKKTKATSVFSYFIGRNSEAFKEISIIVDNNSGSLFKLRYFLLPHVNRPIMICLGLMIFRQFSGVYFLLNFYNLKVVNYFYTDDYGDSTQLIMPLVLLSIVPALVECVFSFILVFLIDRFGRKKLLILSSIGILISYLVLVTSLALVKYDTTLFQNSCNYTNLSSLKIIDYDNCLTFYSIIAATIALFSASFAIGWGPVPWVLVAEYLSLKFKNITLSFIMIVCWLTTLFNVILIDYVFAPNYIIFAIFCIYFGVAIFGLIFVIIFVPETKGKTFSQINLLF